VKSGMMINHTLPTVQNLEVIYDIYNVPRMCLKSYLKKNKITIQNKVVIVVVIIIITTNPTDACN
jgi:hypothetical protein